MSSGPEKASTSTFTARANDVSTLHSSRSGSDLYEMRSLVDRSTKATGRALSHENGPLR